MNDTDLADRLDRSFGAGPSIQPPETHLDAGRRALRRRRMALGTVMMAAVVAVGAGYAVAAPDPGGAEPRVVVPAERPPAAGDPCAVRSVEPPSDGTDVPTVDAGTAASGCPVTTHPGGADGDPDWVRFVGRSEKLVAVDGATVLEQTGEVDLPDDFAGSGDRTAAALVLLPSDARAFVLARDVDGVRPEFIPYPQTPRTGATLDSFLIFAADRYASDDGLR